MSATRTIFAVSALLLVIGNANAEFIGFKIGAQAASQGSGNSSIDIVDDLGTEQTEQSSMILILEHPIAVLPNVRYQGYSLDSTDNRSAMDEGSFNGNALNAANGAATSFDLNHDDVVLYYQLLNNWIDLDMGVDLKRFDGQVSAIEPTAGNVDVDETIPLLHLSARVALPLSGLYVGADINANFIDLGITNSSAQDSTLMLGYDSGNGLGIRGGIKSFSLQLNDANTVNTDLEYDGLFLNGYYNF